MKKVVWIDKVINGRKVDVPVTIDTETDVYTDKRNGVTYVVVWEGVTGRRFICENPSVLFEK